MKRLISLITALVLTSTLIGCSSGTTVSAIPVSLTGIFTGTFTNTPDTQSGTITLNLAESVDGTTVSGNIIFDSEKENCLINAVISDGIISGFSVTLNADQSTTSRSGSTTTSGTINIQLTQSNNGNNLDGTYVTSGQNCSNSTGSGTMSLSRV